jgi:hypothetical protein
MMGPWRPKTSTKKGIGQSQKASSRTYANADGSDDKEKRRLPRLFQVVNALLKRLKSFFDDRNSLDTIVRKVIVGELQRWYTVSTESFFAVSLICSLIAAGSVSGSSTDKQWERWMSRVKPSPMVEES